MNRSRHRLWLRAGAMVVAVAALATGAPAGPFNLNTQITDFNFDNVPINTQPPQTGPGPTDSIPQHIVYSVQTDTGGTIRVNDAGTPLMNKAVVMTTADNGIGESFVDTEFIVAGMQRAVLDFDLAILDAPATGLGQVVGNAPNGQAFVINTFSAQNPARRVFRFVAAPSDANGGVFGMRNNSNGDLILIPGGAYNNGDTHHVQIFMNFAAETVDTYLDGAVTPNLTVPFVEAGASGLAEFFIFQNGVTGDTNQAAWDNLVLFVPEPASLSMLAGGAVAIARRRRARA